MASMDPSLFSLLKFPKSENDVYFSDQVPWLFKEINYYRTYWDNKKTEFLIYHAQSAQRIKEELHSSTSLGSVTRKRLEVLKKAHEDNYLTLSDLLKSLQAATAGSFEVAVPSHQSLHLYRKNIFRDWGWVTAENRQAIQLLTEVIGLNWIPNKVCVLGAGAGRLAMDIHKDFRVPMTVAVDFNPLLLLVAAKMLEGTAIDLWDFNVAPVELESVAKKYQLKSDLGQLDNFHLVCADVTELPFKDHQFSTVVTPWLIDILPFNFKLLVQRVNQQLDIGGQWINFGPLGFSHREDSLNLTRPEIVECLHSGGFELEVENVSRVKYLSSDDEVNSRNETVYVFKAKKIKHIAVESYTFLPQWLCDTSKPIPLSDDIKKHQQLVRFQADLFHSIDGKLSVDQLAQLFAHHYKIPPETALVMVANVLRQLEESVKRK